MNAENVGDDTVRRLGELTEDLEQGRGLNGRRATKVERLPNGRIKITTQKDGVVTVREIDDPT